MSVCVRVVCCACGLDRVVIFGCRLSVTGRLAQMVERPLRMREVGGSIPPMSNLLLFLGSTSLPYRCVSDTDYMYT